MKREIRNPKSHRPTQANMARTQKVIETYHGKNDLLRTYELVADTPANHTTILQLRAKVRMLKNLLLHRADASVRI